MPKKLEGTSGGEDKAFDSRNSFVRVLINEER